MRLAGNTAPMDITVFGVELGGLVGQNLRRQRWLCRVVAPGQRYIYCLDRSIHQDRETERRRKAPWPGRGFIGWGIIGSAGATAFGVRSLIVAKGRVAFLFRLLRRVARRAVQRRGEEAR